MRLIIIGNGFDLHHRLKTSFKDYLKYLKRHNPDILASIRHSKYFIGDGIDIFNARDPFWTDVEGNLEFAYEDMLDDSVEHLDWNEESDARWHRAEFDSEMKVKEIDSSFATDSLANWIRGIDILKAKRIVAFEQSDEFVSFNYTETLEKVYGISPERILHIHGCIADSDSLQFGNSEQTSSVVKKKFENAYGDDDFYGMSIEPAADNYAALADSFSKDIDSNIPKLEEFLTGKNVDEVVIMGHSYSGVDKLYYEKMLIPRFMKAKWTIYCYTDKDFDDALKYISEKKLNGKAVYWN